MIVPAQGRTDKSGRWCAAVSLRRCRGFARWDRQHGRFGWVARDLDLPWLPIFLQMLLRQCGLDATGPGARAEFDLGRF